MKGAKLKLRYNGYKYGSRNNNAGRLFSLVESINLFIEKINK